MSGGRETLDLSQHGGTSALSKTSAEGRSGTYPTRRAAVAPKLAAPQGSPGFSLLSVGFRVAMTPEGKNGSEQGIAINNAICHSEMV
jgi:hypothetical protein